MGLLSKLRSYNGKWNVTSKEAFGADDIASALSSEVVDSEFGMSVKITRNDGTYNYIPVSTTSDEVTLGQKVDLAKCFMITLSRPGDEDIYRIEVK